MFQLRKEDENQLVQSSFEMEKDKIVFKGSHPDSLYRVSTSSGVGTGKLAHALRLMRWPAALVLVCVALAVFVYFLMPDNIETDLEAVNGTYWEQVTAGAGAGAGAQVRRMPSKKEHAPDIKGKATTPSLSQVPQCRSTRLALCRGVLPYDLAGPAATINGVEITNHLPQIEFLIATNCSERVQQFMCALLEPECNPPPYPPKTPCYNLCRAISDSCDGFIPRELSAALNCNQYSSSNCVAAKSPCYPRELGCGDGTCIPRDWICDGAADCPSGEDEAKCVTCQPNEFKCPSGGCILKRWMCDGYADCSGGEDEAAGVCEAHGIVSGDAAPTGRGEPGEESAGSAPAPAVRRPFRIPPKASDRAGDAESSKELLVTSDSTNALKRNYTRRPSLSRLTPYPRQKVSFVRPQDPEDDKPETTRKPQYGRRVTDKKPKESAEDVNVEDLGLFDDVDKGEDKKREEPKSQQPAYQPAEQAPARPEPELTHLDKTINKLEKVIDGAALLRKAAAQQDPPDSPETNSTTLDKDDSAPPGAGGMASAHASPCPSGELRCVDGRCITLAQLCDGTIDCFDHADEDNCYT
ncbi:hypothetical protein ABMA28_006871 [Loxostege sticticalis]|uniref:FZ domain-containing protein n=1 Tax=Loxostege sticticalis TaxID=481309 RepID=A0ABD0TNS9_LOXSC